MALLEVPSVGFEQVVAEGTTPSVLDGGPGHVIGSALPGQAGRSVFTGRRWSSGAPFAFVPALQRGTSIYVTDVLGRFHYVVSNRTGAGRHQSDLVLITAAGPGGVLERATLEVNKINLVCGVADTMPGHVEQPI